MRSRILAHEPHGSVMGVSSNAHRFQRPHTVAGYIPSGCFSSVPMLVRQLAVFSILLVLAGCGARQYVPPTDAIVANLTVRNDSDSAVLPSVGYVGCGNQYLTLSKAGTQIEAELDENKSVTVPIPAEREFTLVVQTFWGVIVRSRCMVVATFVPRRNVDYVAVFHRSDKKCVIAVHEETGRAGGKQRPVQLVKRTTPGSKVTPQDCR